MLFQFFHPGGEHGIDDEKAMVKHWNKGAHQRKFLKAKGRYVGIISHVDELRERIEARLEVSLGKSGSHAKFIMK